MRRFAISAVAVTLVTAACSGSSAQPAAARQAAGCVSTTASLPSSEAGVARLPDDPVLGSVAISAASFGCARDVVVAAAGEREALPAAAVLAQALRAPLLLGGTEPSAALEDELARLRPRRVFRYGDGVAVGDVRSSVLVELPDGSPVLAALTGTARVDPAAVAPPAAPDPAAPTPAAGTGVTGRVWLLADPGTPLAVAAAVAASVSGGLVVDVDPSDLRLSSEAAALIRESPGGARSLHLVGEFGPDAEWQAEVIAFGDPIPGVGHALFPGTRLVALYGNPLTEALGALGEQGSEDGIDRLEGILPGYEADGLTAIPTLEIIATVAAADPGPDGDYSNEMDVADLRPWVEVARREGAYVLLDLQPGRSSFLDQAKRYEELLAEPHVGLALDPEWRLGPHQLHLRQIGRVEAAEVNEVAGWLAELTREHALPQKVLLLHQFRVFMLQDRESIEVPPELAVVIQMDGHGDMEVKMETWQILTTAPDAGRFWWGWKNFYEEDLPIASPEHVVGLTPTVVYVSYQ